MSYFKVRKQPKNTDNKIKNFKLESFVSLTKVEKQKLVQLKVLSRFQWFIESKQLDKNQYFGEKILENNDLNFHTETIKSLEFTKCMVLTRDSLFRILKKILYLEARATEDLLMNSPIFSHLSRMKIRKLCNNCTE